MNNYSRNSNKINVVCTNTLVQAKIIHKKSRKYTSPMAFRKHMLTSDMFYDKVNLYCEKEACKVGNTFMRESTDYINKFISDAVAKGTRTAVLTGNFEIDKAIRIPSDFTLVLDDCHIRLADGCYSNVFVNEKFDTDDGKTKDGRDKNIKILGKGRAIIDGGNYNGLSEKTPADKRPAPLWNNNLILFANVDGFEIKNIHCRNQRWWALNFFACSNGRISDIDFRASDIMIDKDGNIYHGLSRENGLDVLVKNADGIDLRRGCHDIVIENITGFTEDDTIALTAIEGGYEDYFNAPDAENGIYNITIRNVRASSFCTIVRLLNQGGMTLHDINIDNVYDMCESCEYLDKGLYAVRLGDERLYGASYPTADMTYNISIKNVYGRGLQPVVLYGEYTNVVTENINS